MDAVEQKILAAVDAQRETLLAFAQDIGAHAEPGFFETRTAARVAELLRGCGLSPQTGLARTSVKAVLQGGAPGPCAAVIGELDGILCPAHPAANPEKMCIRDRLSSMPDRMAGTSRGSVISKNTRTSPAPRSRAASARLLSMPTRRAFTSI